MNNAKSFVLKGLKGLSITFKPVEKGKDRPVQTMTFNDFQTGQFGLEVDTTITYKTKNSQTPTTARRFLSLARVMEYIAQAAEQSYADAENEPVASPGSSHEAAVEDIKQQDEVAAGKKKKRADATA